MKRQTNTDKMLDLMTCSKAGPLMQAFIFEAVHTYASQVIDAGPPKEREGGPLPIVSPRAWYDCALVALHDIQPDA